MELLSLTPRCQWHCWVFFAQKNMSVWKKDPDGLELWKERVKYLWHFSFNITTRYCTHDDGPIFLFPMYYCSIFLFPIFLFPIFLKKIGISIMFAVFLPNIPIPDISTRFRNNEHNFTKKCSLFLLWGGFAPLRGSIVGKRPQPMSGSWGAGRVGTLGGLRPLVFWFV